MRVSQRWASVRQRSHSTLAPGGTYCANRASRAVNTVAMAISVAVELGRSARTR